MTTTPHNDSVTQLPASVLFVSELNVRKTNTDEGIEELAVSILADGVIENLVAVPELKSAGKPSGRYGVVVGGRRCRALHQLIERGSIAADYPVNCMIVDEKRAVTLSLAENAIRVDMHPADEFEAFRVLIEEGQSIEDVAARFNVTPVVVQRRLKLANVHPELIERYRKNEANLEQMMALAVVDDHERQKAVWDSLPKHSRSAWQLRQRLTEKEVSTTDRRVKFVGLNAYVKAGGTVRRDLFSEKNEGFLSNVELLEQLMTAKLERKAAKLRKEGFAWVEVTPALAYEDRARYGRVRHIERQPSKAERAQLDKLTAKQQALSTQIEEARDDVERSEQLDDELDHLQEQLDELHQQLQQPDPAQQAKAGAIVFINSAGETEVAENLLKPEDAKAFARTACTEGPEDDSKAPRIHSAPLMRKLTAHRTLALRTELAAQPAMALVALTHALALNAFFPCERAVSALEVRCTEFSLKEHDTQLESSPAHLQFESQRDVLRARLPQDAEQLLDWLLDQPQESILELLAFCVGRTVQAVQSEDESHPSDVLATAAAVDMHRWWQPTAAGYFSSVPRARILDVVREFVPPESLAKLEKMKKRDLAQAAETQLATSGWLPERLRLPTPSA